MPASSALSGKHSNFKSVSDMIIRKCKEEDIKSAGAFYDMIVEWLDLHINYPKWMYKVYPSEESVRLMVDEGSQYLCLADGKIVAAFVLNTDPQGNYKKGLWTRDLPEGSYLVLHTLAVDPESRRKGLADEIIRFCTDKAKEGGYQAIRLDIVPGNIPAEHLYKKNGFSCVGDVDLDRGYEEIPIFQLYEKNIYCPGLLFL